MASICHITAKETPIFITALCRCDSDASIRRCSAWPPSFPAQRYVAVMAQTTIHKLDHSSSVFQAPTIGVARLGDQHGCTVNFDQAPVRWQPFYFIAPDVRHANIPLICLLRDRLSSVQPIEEDGGRISKTCAKRASGPEYANGKRPFFAPLTATPANMKVLPCRVLRDDDVDKRLRQWRYNGWLPGVTALVSNRDLVSGKGG